MGRSRTEKPTPTGVGEPTAETLEAMPTEAATESTPMDETSVGSPAVQALDVRRVAYCSRLNLRAAPEMGATILAVLPEGTPVSVDSSQWLGDGTALWMPAVADGLSGWVDARFLESCATDEETLKV